LFPLTRAFAATQRSIPCPIVEPEHLPEKPDGENGRGIGLRSVSHEGNVARSRPASEGRGSERLAASRAAELLGDAFEELQQPVAALAAPVAALGLRAGEVHDAQLLAFLAEGQPAPVARAAGFSPTERKPTAGEAARRTAVLDDGSQTVPSYNGSDRLRNSQRSRYRPLAVFGTDAAREWSAIRNVARATVTTWWQHGHCGFI